MTLKFHNDAAHDRKTQTTPQINTPNTKPPIINPQNNGSVKTLTTAIIAFLVGAGVAGAGTALAYKNQAEKVVTPPALAKSQELTLERQADKDVAGLVAYKATHKENGSVHFPLATKDGSVVFLGSLISGTDEKMLYDTAYGTYDESAENMQGGDDPNMGPYNAQEGDGIPGPEDDYQGEVSQEQPTTRWGATFGSYDLNDLQTKKVSGYYDKGLPKDYFTKSFVGEGNQTSRPTAGSGVFKADLPLFARHVADTLSRETSHSGNKNKDVMANPQNYIWVFHKYDCVYCAKLINGLEDRGNVVYVPLVNTVGEHTDTMTSSNTIKSFAQLDGKHSVYQLENMTASQVKLNPSDYQEQDLMAIKYNTDILHGLHMVLDQNGVEVPKDEHGRYIFGTPTVIYFDRDTGLPQISYGTANEQERLRVFGH